MNNDFYLKADSTSNYLNWVKVLFILNAHKLFFYVFFRFTIFCKSIQFSAPQARRYQICLPFW